MLILFRWEMLCRLSDTSKLSTHNGFPLDRDENFVGVLAIAVFPKREKFSDLRELTQWILFGVLMYLMCC
jgi:hypothetical protein